MLFLLNLTQICPEDSITFTVLPNTPGAVYNFYRIRAGVTTQINPVTDTDNILKIDNFFAGDTVFAIGGVGTCPDSTNKIGLQDNNCFISADFTISTDTFCRSTVATFQAINIQGNIQTYFFNFGPGASPANASGGMTTLTDPINVTYNTPGNKTITLRLTSGTADTIITKVDFIYIEPRIITKPIPNCGTAGGNFVTFVWNGVTGASNYQVRTRTGGSGPFSAWTTPTDSLQHRVTGVTFPDSVFFQMRAFNSCDTTISDTIFCQPKFANCVVPGFTVIPSNPAGCIGDVVTLRLDGFPANSRFKIAWNGTPLDTARSFDYTIPAAGNNVVNYAVVDTTVGTNCFALGDISVIGTPSLTSNPDLGVQSNTSNQVIFNWKTVDNILRYRVQVDTSGLGTYNFYRGQPSSGPTGTEHQVTGLREGKRVDIRVIAIGGCDSTFSDTVITTATDSCTIGYIARSNIDDACAGQPLTLFVSDIQISNYLISWDGNPFTSDSTFEYTPPAANSTFFVRFLIRDPSAGTSCDMLDSIRIKTGNPGNPTWTALQTQFCEIDALFSLENRVDNSGVFFGAGTKLINGRWFFDAGEAGPGDHIITHNVCGATESDTFTVLTKPCVSTLAGSGIFVTPEGIFTTCDGEVYLADRGGNDIYVIDTLGQVITLIGDSTNTNSGDFDGFVGVAQISQPAGVVRVEGTGEVYFTSTTAISSKVKKYDPVTQQVTTVAGSIVGNVPLAGGSVSPLTAQFNNAFGLALSPNGDSLYIVDRGNSKIRVMRIAGGTAGNVSTVVGSLPGLADGPALSAQFGINSLRHIDVDQNYIYIPDPSGNFRIAVLDKSTNIVTTITNSIPFPTQIGYTDGLAGRFISPTAMNSTATGEIYFTDFQNQSIRTITLGNVVNTVAGSAPPVAQAGTASGKPFDARFNNPVALSYNAQGFIDISDQGNKLVRRYGLPEPVNFGPDTFYCADANLDTMASPYVNARYIVVDGDPGLIIDDTIFNPKADTGNVIIGYSYVHKQCDDYIEFNVYIKPPVILNLFPDSSGFL